MAAAAPSSDKSLVLLEMLTGLTREMLNPLRGAIAPWEDHRTSILNSYSHTNSSNYAKGQQQSSAQSPGNLPLPFVKQSKISSEDLIEVLQFIRFKTTLWNDMAKKAEAILRKYDISFFYTKDLNGDDDKGQEKADTLYGDPDILPALMQFLISAFIDLSFVGFTVIAIPIDLIKWCMDKSIWKSLIDNNNLKNRKLKGVNRRRVAQAFSHDTVSSSRVLPFSRVDFEQGNIYHYKNKTEDVLMFEPMSLATRELEKTHRTFVLQSSQNLPLAGRLTTGIMEIYEAYILHEMALNNMNKAATELSKPRLTGQFLPPNKAIVDQTESEQNASIVDLGDVNQMNPFRREAARHVANYVGMGPNSARQMEKIIGLGDNQEKATRQTKISEAQREVTSNANGDDDKSLRSQLSLRVLDQLRLDSLDSSKYAIQDRDEIAILLTPGMQVHTYIKPEICLPHVEKCERMLKEKIANFMTNTFDRSDSDAVATAAAAATASSTGGGNKKTKTSETMSILEEKSIEDINSVCLKLKEIFKKVYRESGAFLDEMHLTDIIAELEEATVELEGMEGIQTYIEGKLKLHDIKVEDLLRLVAKVPELVNGENTKTLGKALKNLEQIDTVSSCLFGIRRMTMLLIRSLSRGDKRDLTMQFKLKRDLMEQKKQQMLISTGATEQQQKQLVKASSIPTSATATAKKAAAVVKQVSKEHKE